MIACDVHPLQNLRVLRYLKGRLGQDQDGLDAWCRHWVGEGLAACEALLGREPAAAFAFGDAPGIAEICLVPQMLSAERFGVDLERMPRLARPARPLPASAGLRRGGSGAPARFRALTADAGFSVAPVEPFRRASTRATTPINLHESVPNHEAGRNCTCVIACNAAFHALSAIGAVFSRRTRSLLSAFT